MKSGRPQSLTSSYSSSRLGSRLREILLSGTVGFPIMVIMASSIPHVMSTFNLSLMPPQKRLLVIGGGGGGWRGVRGGRRRISVIVVATGVAVVVLLWWRCAVR